MWPWPPSQNLIVNRQFPSASQACWLSVPGAQSQPFLTLPGCRMEMRGAEGFTQIPFYRVQQGPSPHPNKCRPGHMKGGNVAFFSH